ncbi:MAG TPA: G1 family glutamic endopeptidase [Gaiellaceae bacterium]|nr:G1 family glutamic endopeptidase [Gaiellaceae bacterium]
MRIVRIVAAATGLIAASVLLGVFAAAASASARVAPTPTQQWSGYAVTNPTGNAGGFTRVTATWKQPKATCRTGAGSAAFWVGLGGFTSDSNKIEQIGAASDCTSANKPKYYAWYDLPPNAGVILSLRVRPADVMTASVRMNASKTQVSLRIANTTTGMAYSTRLPVFSPDVTSAEWITEAPSECDQYGFCQSTPLADFGQVSFTKISAGTASYQGSITDPRWQSTAIELVPGTHTSRYFPEAAGAKATTSRAGAVPNGLTAAGNEFGVKWKADIEGSQPAPAPASPGTYVAGPRRP